MAILGSPEASRSARVLGKGKYEPANWIVHYLTFFISGKSPGFAGYQISRIQNTFTNGQTVSARKWIMRPWSLFHLPHRCHSEFIPFSLNFSGEAVILKNTGHVDCITLGYKITIGEFMPFHFYIV